MRRVLLIDEVAELLRTPANTLRYWRATNQGPPSFRLGRRVAYFADDVDAWVEEQAAARAS